MEDTPKKKPIGLFNIFHRITKWNWRFVRVILVRFILIAVLVPFWWMLFLALSPVIKGFYLHGITSFGEDTIPDGHKVEIVLVIKSPRIDDIYSYSDSVADIEIKSISAPFVFDEFENFCFTGIYEDRGFVRFVGGGYTYTPPRYTRPFSSFSTSSVIDLGSQYAPGGFLLNECIDSANLHGQLLEYANPVGTIGLLNNSRYYFPYDKYTYTSTLSILGTTMLAQGDVTEVSLVPQIEGSVQAPNWDVNIEVDDGTIDLKFARPLLYRVITPVLLLVILGVIMALPFIQGTSTFIETLIGIVFGLWGLHEILIPPDVTWTTIIDPIILTLYALLGFFALLRVAIIPAWKKWGR